MRRSSIAIASKKTIVIRDPADEIAASEQSRDILGGATMDIHDGKYKLRITADG